MYHQPIRMTTTACALGKREKSLLTNRLSSFRLDVYPNFCVIVGGRWPSGSSRRTRKCFFDQNVENCA